MTAEAAIVLPLIAVVALALVWLVSVAILQVRAVDAARDAARAVARGESEAEALAQARRTSGSGTTVTFGHAGDLVTVEVAVRSHSPGWLLVPVPSFTLHARAAVEAEDATAS